MFSKVLKHLKIFSVHGFQYFFLKYFLFDFFETKFFEEFENLREPKYENS